MTGNSFYALFPLKGKRFESVTITDVEPGTWESPLRIHFRSAEIKDFSIDVNICGTNVLGNFIKAFAFGNFFTCENKQGDISQDRWDLIRKEKPVLGMSIAEVELTLGKPLKSNDIETKDGHLLELTYSGY